MFFKTHSRVNPQTGKLSIYYRLVENSRNALGGISLRSIMAVGFMDDVNTQELYQIADGLNHRISGQGSLIAYSDKVCGYVDHLYSRLVNEKRIDRILHAHDKQKDGDWHRINLNSIENKDVRELGAEWMCLQSLRGLQIEGYLESLGWSDTDRDIALAHIICRTVYPTSELKTVRYMKDNSSICELLNLDARHITKDRLYKISHRLFAQKDGLEAHLSRKTNELFDLHDKIILYDLTNTYFEGEMRASELARRGRSKEKRSDCPLMVLALVVNVEGFIKYSAIYEGNKADCKTLEAMVDKLRTATSERTEKSDHPIVVIDAGIATEENLKMLVEKGYDYVCVSRTSLKKYTVAEGALPMRVFDHKQRPIELVQVEVPATGKIVDREYYLKVTSPTKTLKEASMYRQFMNRYEEGLALIVKGINTKGGVKKYDRVNQRVGRLAQKYPSVHNLYDIRIEKNQKEMCTSMTWTKKEQSAKDKENKYGVYFLRTSIKQANENLVWTVYNCIREVEKSIRTLKTDLDLRPIYHKTDEASQAHLHLGLMAYWVVNTIRHQLKGKGVTSDWRELVRVMNTQKCVTTNMVNDKGQHISVRCCSKPEPQVARLYDALKMEHAPFIRKKSVGLKIEPEKVGKVDMLKDTS